MAAVVHDLLEKVGLAKQTPTDAPPREPSSDEVESLQKKFADAQQDHVFTFWDSLSNDDKARLYQQLEGIDPKYINEITDRALNPPKTEGEDKKPDFKPLPDEACASIIDTEDGKLKGWYDEGLKLISQGQVAVVLMAGGQGTRLGSSAPKGCYDIGLPSHKSLFQLQGERIAKLQMLAKQHHAPTGGAETIIPWYVMTSGPTRKPTEEFFQKHNYFGLKQENVFVFEQGVLPCIDNDGKILLESKSRVAVAPDGNGGLYHALVTAGVVEDMRRRGTKHVHAYCVDNCLVRVADPTFMGFAAEKTVDIATKVVRKRNAKESVGLILSKNGKADVVEYSEISTEMAEETDVKHNDLLKYRAANIVNHYYSFQFLESITDWVHRLPHHVAKKKIPYTDLKSGEAVKPSKPNGIKLEQFVFDCFPFLEMSKFACLEVKREDEFSPLKNAPGTGEDDPGTSQKDIMTQGRRWISSAGGTVVGEDMSQGVEVSPLISYGGEGLEFLREREIKAPAAIEKED